MSFAFVSASVSCEKSTCADFSPSSSSFSAADALVSASDKGVPAREEKTDDGMELALDKPAFGARSDDPPVDGAKLKSDVGGGLAGVVENSPGAGVAGWNWNSGLQSVLYAVVQESFYLCLEHLQT
jgi:hypothetical protein